MLKGCSAQSSKREVWFRSVPHLAVILGVVVCALGAAGQSARRIIRLDETSWRLSQCLTNEGEAAGIPLQPNPRFQSVLVNVPNDVHLTPFVKNPLDQSPETGDVSKREWWYARTFDTPRFSSTQQVMLVFEGVDYFADVWLNGVKLGSHEGAFTSFRFDITNMLSKTENYIAVRVTSPWRVPGRSHYEFMKGGYEERWDALPGPGQVVFPLGLHRGVHLEITHSTRVDDVQVWTASLKDELAELNATVNLVARHGRSSGTVQVSIVPENFAGARIDVPAKAYSIEDSAGNSIQVHFTIDVKNPQLWWTWDLGPQNLYRARVELLNQSGTLVDSTSTVFGIRTIERDSNLLYRLNGRKVFLRGSWYAMSSLYTASTEPWTYEKDLRLARNANMNHLATYTVIEKDDFYDLADRLGILLFVELPFNQEGPIDALNRNYPRRQEFIRWSSAEVAQIIRRLRNHPSIGLWDAVAEVTTNGKDIGVSWDPRVAEAADGYRMFLDALRKVVGEEDPQALYQPSFCDFGETHFWEGGLMPGSTYDQQFDEAASFVSEYGALGTFPYEDAARAANLDELWGGAAGDLSPFRAPLRVKRFSYALPWQYTGLDMTMAYVGELVTRKVDSFRDFMLGSQIYQSALYGYAGDAYRRKIFNPVNGVRSWMFKSFPEVPVGGFGVVDAFGIPLPAYYAQKRTYSPVTMSFAIRNPFESVPGGSDFKASIWLSNVTDEERRDVSVDYALYDLEGNALQRSNAQVSIPAYRAEKVEMAQVHLPEEAGIYILRGRAVMGSHEIARAGTYVKIAPAATRRPLRVLLIGSPEWAFPVAGYLEGFGAQVTTAVDDETVVRPPQFPASAEEIERRYDLIWLAGYDGYWREAPESLNELLLKAVKAGVTFVHSGSMGSFHGGGEDTAALDLTPIADLLPVTLTHENDVYLKSSYRAGLAPNALAAETQHPLTVAPNAPQWLQQAAFSGLGPESFHMLAPKSGSTVLLKSGDLPMLVTGQYGKGKTIAWMGFTPQAAAGAERRPVILDRAIIESQSGRLFAMVTAAVLAIASGEEPPAEIAKSIEDRSTPLFENLVHSKLESNATVSATWTTDADGHPLGHVRIENGDAFDFGLRVRFTGPDEQSGRLLQLWSDQYFDLLPHEAVEATVTLFKRGSVPAAPLVLTLESKSGNEIKVPVDIAKMIPSW